MKIFKIGIVGILCFGISAFASAADLFDPAITNLNNDNITNFADFAIMADNWGKTGSNLPGDFDDSNTVDTDDLVIFSWYWLDEYSEYQQCQRADLDSDGIIAFEDLSNFAENWLVLGEGLTGDFDDSNSVDYEDLYVLSDCWLKGSRPQGIWEQFKAALAAGEINDALGYIAQISRDKYSDIFTAIEPNLPDFAAGMGDLTLQSQDAGEAKYEMLYQTGSQTYSFPIVFVKDDGGNWRILNF